MYGDSLDGIFMIGWSAIEDADFIEAPADQSEGSPSAPSFCSFIHSNTDLVEKTRQKIVELLQ